MNNWQEWGKIMIFTGLFIFALGSIITLLGQHLSWLGNLPGDIRIEKENFKLYFPLTTMLLISFIINTVIYFIKILLRFF